MSRRSTGPLRAILPAAAVGLAALLGAVGCSAGQVTQTDSIEPAVNGNAANVGDLALRDVLLAYPGEDGGYTKHGSVPLRLTIVNSGRTDDRLVSVSSPAAAGDTELIGNPSIPARTALHIVVPEADASIGESAEPSASATVSEESVSETTGSSRPETSGSASSSSSSPETVESAELSSPSSSEAPAEVGTMSVVLMDLTMDLPIGRNVPVTFVFANAGSVTVQVPTASPGDQGPEPTDSGPE